MQRHLSLLILTAFAAAAVLRGAEHRSAPSILEFSLQERESDLVRKLGPSEHVSGDTTYRTLDYLLGSEERNDEDFDWTFYFEKPSGILVSVIRNFVTPRNVDQLLGPDFRFHEYPANPQAPLQALSRVLPGGRVLIAIGLKKPGEVCSQLVLMRRSALPRFYPWIATDLR
jgi:hypothetical protein